MDIRIPQGAQAAKIAKGFLKTLGVELTDDQAMELAARLHGYGDRTLMAEDHLFDGPMALRADSCTEYTLLGPEYSGVWVKVKSVLVEIGMDPAAVTIDIYPASPHASELLGELAVPFKDALKALQEIEDNPPPNTNPFVD